MVQTQSLSDAELVRMYAKGQEQAFETLLQRSQKQVFTSIYLFVKDRYIAEDIFQETFIKVVTVLKSGNYKDEGKFTGWVMRIAQNLCIDYYRKSKRSPIPVTTSDGKDIFNVLKFREPDGEEQMIRKQSQQSVRDMINQLPDEQREILILRHYANLSFKEIASLTGININTALGRMRYALMNMRKMKQAVALMAG